MHVAELNIGRLNYPIDDPRMADFVDNLARVNAMADRMPGFVWRLVGDGSLPLPTTAGVTAIDLGTTPEAEGVVAAWMQRHGCHAALVRPDHYVYGTAADDASLEALLAERSAALA